MARTCAYPFLLEIMTSDKLDGFVIVQVNDSLDFGSQSILAVEKEASKRFKVKQWMDITNEVTTFSGLPIFINNE